ncbi:hypothetical protein CBS101457_006823 [Exobasidium rhododendri]|nr:hypothetical protein CBS101457_006823 [Exobasidium rhododendri]
MATATVQRTSSQYEPLHHLSDPFLVPLSSRRYNRQFSTLYDYRLRRLKHPKGRLVKRATEEWWEGKGATSALMMSSSQSSSQGSVQIKANYVKRILDVKQGQICFVVGIIYCSMHLKPDVLEELTREQYLPPQPASEKYADPERDEFFIEDESGRVRLVGSAVAPDGHLRASLVTGVVVAILGTETRSGDFEVADAIFAGVPEYNAKADTTTKKEDSMDVDDAPIAKGWVALVSGLELETSAANVIELKLMLLTDWLLGHVGEADERGEVSQITSLIIAGNSMTNALRGDEDKVSRNTMPAPSNSYPTSNLDNFLVDIASTMHVHLLPGEKDPTSLALPQQPMHHSLFPKASRFETLHRESNPGWFGIQQKKFLGSSGQNINDIFKYMVESDDEARIQAACNTLDWGHLAPTAPDTLSCYPLSDRDPFLIEEAPDVYFIGNQERFATRLYECSDGHSIRVVLLPNFAASGEVMLVQPSTLAIKKVQIASVI